MTGPGEDNEYSNYYHPGYCEKCSEYAQMGEKYCARHLQERKEQARPWWDE